MWGRPGYSRAGSRDGRDRPRNGLGKGKAMSREFRWVFGAVIAILALLGLAMAAGLEAGVF